MLINRAAKEIQFKIVYYGPGKSGKTTSLEYVHNKIAPQKQLVSIKTAEDRTLFFDFMDLSLPKISEFSIRINLFTVPGQTYYKYSRKIVLQGADAVIFVADSSPNKMKANIASFLEMLRYMKEFGINPSLFPIILQYNKRDLPNAIDISLINKFLNPKNRLAYFETVAISGEGVLDALKKTIYSAIENNLTKFRSPRKFETNTPLTQTIKEVHHGS
ncbi:GTPase domain-containing protein [bacterium]|nr:GTPase domain-containing protein [bacterium]